MVRGKFVVVRVVCDKYMNIQKNQIKQSTVELTITVDQAEYQPFLIKAAGRLSQATKIEGFRPGKAPYDIVKQRVGEMSIYQEALDDIISYFYYQAVITEKLNTIGQPKIDLEKLAPANPIVFKATTALMPTVKLGHYKDIQIKKKEVKVEDSAVEQAFNDLRKMQVKEVVVDHPAKMGDRVEIDFETSLDKVVIDGGQGKKYAVVLGDHFMIPGFEEQLVGLTKDEEKTFQLKFPDDYQNKMMAGKICDFKVKLLSVYQRDLPALTDEWAKNLGAESIKDLGFRIKKNLEDEKMFHEEQRLEIEMLNKIVAQTEFSEIPELLIESEAHRMVHEFEYSIAEQGLNFADYLKSLKKEEKDVVQEFKPKALERVKTSLVIKEIAELEKIEANSDELKQETEKILEQVRGNREAEDNIKSEGYQQYLQTIIRNRKVVEMLKKKCLK